MIIMYAQVATPREPLGIAASPDSGGAVSEARCSIALLSLESAAAFESGFVPRRRVEIDSAALATEVYEKINSASHARRTPFKTASPVS